MTKPMHEKHPYAEPLSEYLPDVCPHDSPRYFCKECALEGIAHLLRQFPLAVEGPPNKKSEVLKGTYNCPVCGWNRPHAEHCDVTIERQRRELESWRAWWQHVKVSLHSIGSDCASSTGRHLCDQLGKGQGAGLQPTFRNQLAVDGPPDAAQVSKPPCRVCGGSGFVAQKQFIDDGYGEVDSCPACVLPVDEPQEPTIELVRQRTTDFGDGYRAGYDDGLEGNASDVETAWDRSRASAELASVNPRNDEEMPRG